MNVITDIVEQYIQDSNINNKKKLKKFCYEVFDVEKNSIKIKGNIRFRVICVPFFSNGWTRIRGKQEYKVNISVNIFPYLRKTEVNEHMKYFYLYTSVLHEIEHVKIYFNLGYEKEYNYVQALAYIEQTKNINAIIGELLGGKVDRKNRESSMKSYFSSSTEQLCCTKSISKTSEIFEKYMLEEEKNLIKGLLDTFYFLEKYLEIGYRSNNVPYNKFLNLIIQGRRGIIKNKYNKENFPQIFEFYDGKGRLKSIDQMYEERNSKNSDMIDKILLMTFSSAKKDFFDEFQDNISLKLHIEYLINNYFKDCKEYFLNQDKYAMFFCDEILRENGIVLKNNIKHFNSQLKKYGMTCQGGIFPVNK